MNSTDVNNLIKIRALMEKLNNDQDKVINKSFEKNNNKRKLKVEMTKLTIFL